MAAQLGNMSSGIERKLLEHLRAHSPAQNDHGYRSVRRCEGFGEEARGKWSAAGAADSDADERRA